MSGIGPVRRRPGRLAVAVAAGGGHRRDRPPGHEGRGLRAVIVRVTEGSKVVANQAFGPSLAGQPATTAMHFRNGSVAFSCCGTRCWARWA